jgi:uncharacterized membrane protein YccC
MDPNNPGGVFIFVAVAASLAIVLGLRTFAPGKRWLAISLAVLFGPCGHLYLKGAARYIALMYLAWAGLLVLTPLPPLVSGLLLMVLSGLLMDVRLRKHSEADLPKIIQ